MTLPPDQWTLLCWDDYVYDKEEKVFKLNCEQDERRYGGLLPLIVSRRFGPEYYRPYWGHVEDGVERRVIWHCETEPEESPSDCAFRVYPYSSPPS